MWVNPKEWLIERVDPTNPLALLRLEFENAGVLQRDWERLWSQAHPAWAATWKEFISDMLPEDEVWRFSSSEASWREFAGRRGYCIVRSCQPIKSLLTAKS